MRGRWLAPLLLPFLLFGSWLNADRRAQPLPTVTPTPTYDPLVEPPLPPAPTQLELGRNLYWHWCMPCHGDRGQGLTDEFRMIWEPDHQDCWAGGCHGGRPRDEGFPIPTVVPALTREDRLGRFASLGELEGYLTETHPPQSPGILKPEEYEAISAWLFEMNEREEPKRLSPLWLLAVLPVLAAGGLLLKRRARNGD